MIYDMLPNCRCMWDVGTDHGFLPIYAVNNEKCHIAIASDLREGPLNIAKKNIKEANLENRIKTILCPGLSCCMTEICDAVVIAGMGGLTICNILSDWMEHIKDNYFPGNITFILQPNTHEYEVRKFLNKKNFFIEDERAVKDAGHMYLGIKCIFKNSAQNIEYSEIQYYTGQIMPRRLSVNDIMYLKSINEKYKNILCGLAQRINPDEDTLRRIETCNKIIEETGIYS